MINERCLKEVTEFLKDYPNPGLRIATTMYDGYVTCIKPIKTICGAELMCSPKTEPYVRNLIKL